MLKMLSSTSLFWSDLKYVSVSWSILTFWNSNNVENIWKENANLWKSNFPHNYDSVQNPSGSILIPDFLLTFSETQLAYCDTLVLCICTKQLRDFLTVNISNATRVDPWVWCSTIAKSIWFLDVISRNTVFSGTFSSLDLI